MEFLGMQEVFIPADAEVKKIPLLSLPQSVLKRMGLYLSDAAGSSRLTGSPEGIWICPAVLRPKGQRNPSNRGNSMLENTFPSLAREFGSAPGPLKMSFVTSSQTARRVLKDTLHGANSSADTSSTSLLPPGSAPNSYQMALVIYQGLVYLSIRRPGQSKRQGETREPQPAAQAPVPATSRGYLSHGTRQPPNLKASPKPADGQPQKKRLRITLPKPPKQRGGPAGKSNSQTTTDQVLLNGSRSRGNPRSGGEVSSSQTAVSVPQSTVRVQRANNDPHHDAGAEQTAENKAAWLPEDGSNNVSETQEPEDEVQSSNNVVTDGGNSISMQSWSRTEPQSASTSQQQELVFQELQREEEMAMIMAQLKQHEANAPTCPTERRPTLRQSALNGAQLLQWRHQQHPIQSKRTE